jgi:hypothetical protein
MSAVRVRSLIAALAALALAASAVVAACTDGTTPDCSDAATQCGPNVGDSAVDGGDATADTSLPDTSLLDTGADTALDTGADTGADADLDAGDAG